VNALNADALYSLYDAAMKNAFPADRTREFMQGLQAQFGNVRKIESIERPVATTRRFRLQFEPGPLIMEITVNADDTIAGLSFRPRVETRTTTPSDARSLRRPMAWLRT